jgi:hypothetical protein
LWILCDEASEPTRAVRDDSEAGLRSIVLAEEQTVNILRTLLTVGGVAAVAVVGILALDSWRSAAPTATTAPGAGGELKKIGVLSPSTDIDELMNRSAIKFPGIDDERIKQIKVEQVDAQAPALSKEPLAAAEDLPSCCQVE